MEHACIVNLSYICVYVCVHVRSIHVHWYWSQKPLYAPKYSSQSHLIACVSYFSSQNRSWVLITRTNFIPIKDFIRIEQNWTVFNALIGYRVWITDLSFAVSLSLSTPIFTLCHAQYLFSLYSFIFGPWITNWILCSLANDSKTPVVLSHGEQIYIPRPKINWKQIWYYTQKTPHRKKVRPDRTNVMSFWISQQCRLETDGWKLLNLTPWD